MNYINEREYIKRMQSGILLENYSLTDMLWFMHNYNNSTGVSVYIVTITFNTQETSTVFATLDKKEVTSWVNRFTKIIDRNRDRLLAFDIDCELVLPFWHDYIVYEDPIAMFTEVKLK